MTKRKDYIIDTSKIKTLKDVRNIFECLGIICDISLLGENDPKYELVKEYFVVPYVEEPHKSIEELKEEFENTLDNLLVKTKRKFAVSKEGSEYRFNIKSKEANERFEYAKTYGHFPPILFTTGTGITTSSNVPNSYLSVSNSALSWGTEFNLNPSKNSVGYYFVVPDVKFNMTKRPNRIVQFFMRNLLGFNWVDKK
jgi:hypothetical protein